MAHTEQQHRFVNDKIDRDKHTTHVFFSLFIGFSWFSSIFAIWFGWFHHRWCCRCSIVFNNNSNNKNCIDHFDSIECNIPSPGIMIKSEFEGYFMLEMTPLKKLISHACFDLCVFVVFFILRVHLSFRPSFLHIFLFVHFLRVDCNSHWNLIVYGSQTDLFSAIEWSAKTAHQLHDD